MNEFQLLDELNQLPTGYISRKVIQGKERFYLQWKENGKVKSRYLKEGEKELLEPLIARRRELQKELQAIRSKSRREELLQNQKKRVAAYAERFLYARNIAIGKQDFVSLREGNSFYVDKTDFISEWWGMNRDVTLITRPRRFGKTLTLSTVEAFFSNRFENRGELFTNLKVWQDTNLRELQGTFPVIMISFGSVKATNFELAMEQIATEIVYTYKEYQLDFEGSVQHLQVLQNSIRDLSRILYEKYGKNAIILMDEYDTPMTEAYVHGYWNEMAEFMRPFFNATFKSNGYMERALITGITRVGKESLFSDLNHVLNASSMSPYFSTSFGFTEREVFSIADRRGMNEESKQRIKFWYDGFSFGEERDIYNPWSITNYFAAPEYFLPYWSNSGGMGLINHLTQSGTKELKCDLEQLLNGQSLWKRVDESIQFERLEEDENAIWTLLEAAGYLKVLRRDSEDASLCELVVTNHEVMLAWEKMFETWVHGTRSRYSDFIQALMLNDEEYMNEYLQEVFERTFSYYDVEEREPERFYHGFVLGLIADLKDSYIIRSNRESGLGRYDVCMIPRKQNNPAYILEFKVRNPRRESSLEETADAAIGQIVDKEYKTELLAGGITEGQIHMYGIAFEGKRVLVRAV